MRKFVTKCAMLTFANGERHDSLILNVTFIQTRFAYPYIYLQYFIILLLTGQFNTLRIKCALFVYSHSSEIFLILFKLILTLLHLLHFIILHFYSFLTFPSRKYAILTISKALFTIDADLVLACYSTYVIYQKVGPKFPNHSGTHRWMVHCKMLIYKLHFLLNLCTMIQ